MVKMKSDKQITNYSRRHGSRRIEIKEELIDEIDKRRGRRSYTTYLDTLLRNYFKLHKYEVLNVKNN